MSQTVILANESIRARQVRLVDDAGKQIAVLSTRDAIYRARSEDLDLVQIGSGDIPVCKILDYGKYVFEKKKMQRENAKRQRELSVDVKEIQLRPGTDLNDIRVKAKKAIEFLEDGDKVKVVVRFRGRERAHKDQGRKIIETFVAHLGEHKSDPVIDSGRDMQVVISPVKTKSEIYREKHKNID